MTTTYKPVDADVRAILEEVMEEDFPDLTKIGVTVLLQFAYNSTGCALKHHGYPAHAIVSIVKLKDRVEQMQDCRVEIDGAAWEENDQDWRRALLSHEMQHVVVVRDKKGKVKYDEAGRPRLKLRVHDWNLGGFHRTAELYKGKALEVQQFAELHKTFVQRNWNWF